jgi:hypothetical protein
MENLTKSKNVGIEGKGQDDTSQITHDDKPGMDQSGHMTLVGKHPKYHEIGYVRKKLLVSKIRKTLNRNILKKRSEYVGMRSLKDILSFIERTSNTKDSKAEEEKMIVENVSITDPSVSDKFEKSTPVFDLLDNMNVCSSDSDIRHHIENGKVYVNIMIYIGPSVPLKCSFRMKRALSSSYLADHIINKNTYHLLMYDSSDNPDVKCDQVHVSGVVSSKVEPVVLYETKVVRYIEREDVMNDMMVRYEDHIYRLRCWPKSFRVEVPYRKKRIRVYTGDMDDDDSVSEEENLNLPDDAHDSGDETSDFDGDNPIFPEADELMDKYAKIIGSFRDDLNDGVWGEYDIDDDYYYYWRADIMDTAK